MIEALAESGLTLTALSLRFEGPDFADGAFTSPRAETRERAIRLAQDAVELAARLAVPHVDLWMAYDGFDYPFQVDYDRLWADEVDGFRRVAAHDPAIRISVEYKPLEPRRTALIRGMGEALLAVRDVGLPNFGVQIDFCHSLMAREQPAMAAALALREGRLFGVHLNDGYGQADDGLLVGSVHPWQTLELLATLRRHDYRGTIYFDTFPVREDPAAESAANVARVRALEAVLTVSIWINWPSCRRATTRSRCRRCCTRSPLAGMDTEAPAGVCVVGSVHMDVVATADRLPGKGESVVGHRVAPSRPAARPATRRRRPPSTAPAPS